MLVVRTYLDKAGAKGIGLFAAELVPKGKVWWKDDRTFNKVICRREMEACKLPILLNFIETYGCQTDKGDWIVCVDNGRFVNHSNDPNTAADASGDWIATRDIAAGDEITSDYRELCRTCRRGVPFENKE